MSAGTAYEVVIIGAGPAGLAAALYTGRARLHTLVLEKAIPGGQILLTDWVENYPGFPDGIAPFDLMDSFRKQAERFGALVEIDEARAVRREENHWVVEGQAREYGARAVIIATGAAYRQLGVPNEARLTGKGVSYCATCDGPFFRDAVVAVVGGGDNALTEAVLLTKFCRKLYLIHRRDQFRAIRILQERVLTNPKIEVLWNSVVEAAEGESHLERAVVRNVKENRVFPLPLDGLFISIGMDPHTGFVKGVVELNEWGEIRVDPRMATSQPGIYAAGDVADACPKQVATAAGAGVSAALSVNEYLERNP
ncbi:MAG: thioredoxin-disulfide reductase [Candidatus Aminicenantes bacterium RBG_13_62_12]|jgi:thioredoxin reductase (NADPH)|nr:MAG: thioredoxin-disulfide reductase [Candidatus Aminicenantes bacterium RBG_13_62_12]